ncbi:hypothetical protein [Wenyingzhuangia marina]|uniref:DUF4382 domain-containing protein n=1 Tax=Wenyingzhuangia marina TaxID=1195760 RepID=A0A1M5SUR3_9FLAO|nr:hypothetical protein [Wenyingzhuangia marina]GGF64152.1 hypothetical protein GCM10011397_03930 [Wenyingzhuangia marina]SHH42301.1 hypothetical protein SAMN05444281_0535 [Wenyingzhuangia marina]
MIKQYNYLIVFISLSLLTACGGWDFGDEDGTKIGIGFEIYNNYDKEIEDLKIIIGGINQEDIFVAVDTFNLPTIKLKSEIINSNDDGQTAQLINLKNRWNPDFDKIKTISDKAYFKAVLANGDNYLIESGGTIDKLISIDLVKHKVIKNLLGKVILYIDDELKVTGTISDIP